MKLINRNELINRIMCLEIDEDIIEEVLDAIEDLPYLDAIKLTNGDLQGTWHE